MDNSIDKQSWQLARLCAQRNSALPIFRLPPETLAAVFTHGARDHFESNLGRPTSNLPSWVNVSYVCSHWRSVALGCQALWAYHFIMSLRWTEELLIRSKQTPLKIRIDYRSGFRRRQWWLTLVEKLLKNSERIEELHLNIPPALLPAEPLLCAPHLKNLEVTVNEIYYHPPDSLEITNSYTPLLHTLKLDNCPLLWYQLKLDRLTVLRLRHVPPSCQRNVMDFLAMLRCMQDIRVLDVSHALTSPGGLPPSKALGASPQIDLPHLTHFAVVAPFSAIIILVSSINILSNAETRLHFLIERDISIDDYALIPSLVAQRFSMSKGLSSCSPMPRSLTISSTWNSPNFTFSALEQDCDPEPPINFSDRSCNIPLVVSVGNNWPTEKDRYRIINDICRCTPPMTLQSLYIDGLPLDLDFWRPLLTHFHALRYMKLSNGYMPDLASLLVADDAREARPGDGDRVTAARHVFVPELEALVLFRVTFSSARDLPSGVICQQSLLDALSSRGLRDRLTMVECKAI